MKTRTKWFLGVLLACLVIGSIVSGESFLLVRALVVMGVAWVAWRVFVFVVQLLRPVRAVIAPQTKIVNDHIDQTLRRSGMGKLADIGAKFQRGLDGAVEATQRGIDERNK